MNTETNAQSWFNWENAKKVLETAVTVGLFALDIALVGVGAPFAAGAAVALVKGAWDHKEEIVEFINLVKGDEKDNTNQQSNTLGGKEKELAPSNNKEGKTSAEVKKQINEQGTEFMPSLEDKNSAELNSHNFTDKVDPEHTHNSIVSEHSFVAEVSKQESYPQSPQH